MADSNVEALTALTAANAVDTDLLYIWDIGESGIARSKKMTIGEVKKLSRGTFESEYIPAGAMVPNTTDSATTATFETATNEHAFDSFNFIGVTTNQQICFDYQMPDTWDLGTIKVKFYTAPATGASSGDDYTFEIKAVSVGNDDTMDVAYGTGHHIDQEVSAGVDADLHISAATASITVGGTPALEDLIQFKITRLQDDAADNMPEDAKLRGIAIQYKTLTTAVAEW